MHAERGAGAAQDVARPAWRGEIPYAEPATADEVRALAARVRRRVAERQGSAIERVRERILAAAGAAGIVERTVGGIVCLRASAVIVRLPGIARAIAAAGDDGPVRVRLVSYDLEEGLEEAGPAPPPARVVLREVARLHNIDVAALIGQRRTRMLTGPRFIACWMLRELHPMMSLPAVGRYMGGRDHTTVLYACRRVAAQRAADPDYAARLDAIRVGIAAAWRETMERG